MTLEDIKEQGNNAAVWKAACFYNIMTEFDFIATLQMAVELFGQTIILSVRLQKPNQTFGKCMKLVKDTIIELV